MTTTLRAFGFDLSARGDVVVMRVLTDTRSFDVPLRTSHAAALGLALSEYASEVHESQA
jgi:hypothetical protein